MLQSSGFPMPNCVLAQSRLENIRRASLSRGSDSEINNSNSSSNGSSSSDEDSNSDLGDQYQELVHLNAPQRSHRREGIARFDNICHAGFDLPTHKQWANRIGDQNFTQPEDRHHLSHQQTIRQKYHSLGASQHQASMHCQQQQTQAVPLPPQQQSNHRQRHDPYASSSAFKHHLSHMSLRSDLHNNGRHHHSEHHQAPSYNQPGSNPHESQFPPLHDSSKGTVNMNNVLSDQSRTAATDYSLNQRMAPIRPLREKSPKAMTKQRPLPPPLTIPATDRRSLTFGQDDSTDMSSASASVNADTKLSPSASTSSPESPSSLAIHLYVHHHHHHPTQGSTQGSTLTSTVLGLGTGNNSMSGGSSVSLLSPLTIPLTQSSQPTTSTLEQSVFQESSPDLLSIPTPASQQPHSVYNHAPAQLLEPVPCIELSTSNRLSAASSDQQQSLLMTRPVQLLQRKPSSPTAPTLEDGSQELERSGHRGLLHHPLLSKPSTASKNIPSVSSLPAVASTTPVFSTLIPAATRVSPRRHRPPQPRPRLFDPLSASRLLSTIPSKDLARLYVHAAHHLHSHQPIYRYVLMKMMMTQAEFVQYGRLRAEMPRAPGPSTGARPKRIGFGTHANTGLAARPKKPSKLGLYVTNGPGCGKRRNKHELGMNGSSSESSWTFGQGGQRCQGDMGFSRISQPIVQRPGQDCVDNVDSIGRTVMTATTTTMTTTMTTTTMAANTRMRRPNVSSSIPEKRRSWSQSLACLASLSNKDDHETGGAKTLKKTSLWYGIPSLLFPKVNPKRDSSCAKTMLMKVKSESSLIYSPKCLEELELGTGGEDDMAKAEHERDKDQLLMVTSQRREREREQRSWSHGSDNQKDSRKRSDLELENDEEEELEEEDDEDYDDEVEEKSKSEEEQIRLIDHSEDPYLEPRKHVDVRSYWTLWRRKLQHQGGGQRRQLVRTVDPSFSGDAEMRTHDRHQYQQHQRQDRHPQPSLQQCNSHSMYSISTSSAQPIVSTGTIPKNRLVRNSKDNKHSSSSLTKASPSPVSVKYQRKLDWQNRIHLDPHGSDCALSSSMAASSAPLFVSGASSAETSTISSLSPEASTAAAAAATSSALRESFGYSYSGLLMVSVLFCFLCLIEGSNQFSNLQAALLSIIL